MIISIIYCNMFNSIEPLFHIVPTEEQQSIRDCLQTNNVQVQAGPGVGKTTTILYCISSYPKLNFLFLTYNNALCSEVNSICSKYNKYDNWEIRTFHGFTCTHYQLGADRDIIIDDVLRKKRKPNKKFHYDVIIIDEVQDMTPLYFCLVNKIIQDDDGQVLRMMVVGDEKQALYPFLGADKRFLTMANYLFDTMPEPWVNKTLSQTHRLTKQMVAMTKNVFNTTPNLISYKNGPPVDYRIINTYTDEPCNILDSLLKEYLPHDIYVLNNTVRGHVMSKLANHIADKYPDIKIFMTSKDTEKLDPNVIKDKIVLTTCFSVKGLERKAVLLLNFDNYRKEDDAPEISCHRFVGLTRAQEELIITHHKTNDYLGCVDKDKLPKFTNKIGEAKPGIKKNGTNSDYSVTQLVNYLSFEVEKNVIDKLIPYVYPHPDFQEHNNSELQTVVKFDDSVEYVASILGNVIPLLFEKRIKNLDRFINMIKIMIEAIKDKEVKKSFGNQYTNICNKFKFKQLTELEYIAKLSLLEQAVRDGVKYKMQQIKNFDWLNADKEKIEKRLNIMLEEIDTKNKQVDFEIEVELEMVNKKKLRGVIDCMIIGEDTIDIYEFKCTNRVEPEHLFQLMLYALIVERNVQINPHYGHLKNKKRRYFIYNILSDERFEIKYSEENFYIALNCLMEHQNEDNRNKKLTDDEFMAKIGDLYGQYFT